MSYLNSYDMPVEVMLNKFENEVEAIMVELETCIMEGRSLFIDAPFLEKNSMPPSLIHPLARFLVFLKFQVTDISVMNGPAYEVSC